MPCPRSPSCAGRRGFGYCTGVKSIGTCLWIVGLAALAGCTSNLNAPAGVRLDGIETSVGLRPRLPTKAYVPYDDNTADIYLTDLPEHALQQDADLAGVSGTIVHIHLFAVPRAGKTPIADTASTAAVRTLVVANGHLGVYGGGGFMLPSEKPGGKAFGGSIRAASVRLTGTTPGFEDKLGAAEFSASVTAPLDETRARFIAARLEALVRETQPIQIGADHDEAAETPEEQETPTDGLTPRTESPEPTSPDDAPASEPTPPR